MDYSLCTKEVIKLKKSLVVYYSWSNGNTKRIAQEICDKVNADIVRIDTVNPYPKDYDATVNQGQEEVNRNFRPDIKPLGVSVLDYDVIVVGTPTWWYTMAPAVATFLESTNLDGKIVIPFMTNGGWPGHVIKDMEAYCKNSRVVCPKEIQFDSQGKDHLITKQTEIDAWIESIKQIVEEA